MSPDFETPYFLIVAIFPRLKLYFNLTEYYLYFPQMYSWLLVIALYYTIAQGTMAHYEKSGST